MNRKNSDTWPEKTNVIQCINCSNTLRISPTFYWNVVISYREADLLERIDTVSKCCKKPDYIPEFGVSGRIRRRPKKLNKRQMRLIVGYLL